MPKKKPRRGHAAGRGLENSVTGRTDSRPAPTKKQPRPARQTRTIDVEPNWRRLGTIIDDMIADLTPEST